MRMNLARTQHERRGDDGDAAEGQIFAWSPQGEVNLHAPRRWGYLEFVASE
jgi:hypothetical protein